MSESIFTILTNGRSETKVKGYGDFNMTLPTTMPTAVQFENSGDLYDWTMDHGITHSCLQKGVQKHLIDLRAKFRTVKKGEDWNLETAQSNVADAEWTVVTPGVVKKTAEETTRDYLASLTPEELAEFLAG